MEQLGLKPTGDNPKTYFQHVPLVAYRPTGPAKLTLHGGTAAPLAFAKDYIAWGSLLGNHIDVDAPLAFAGFGVVAPEHHHDDYKGLDVRGKIVVVFTGAPKSFQTEERAYYRSSRIKAQEAKARGAVGMISVNTKTEEKLYPFADTALDYKSWDMTWRTKDGKPFIHARLPYLAYFSLAGAQKLFAGSKVPVGQLLDIAEMNDGNFSGFLLPQSLHAVIDTETKLSESENIIGILPGADPKLKDQYVVLSAHLDHLGITEPVKGDAINNGALDNASGVATTLEVARLFRASGKPPRRSIMFLIDTAEEKGLVGSEYFANNPTVPPAGIASDVDIDMPVLTYDFTDVVSFGGDRSTIGPAIRQAAAAMHLKVSPDPMPDEGFFTRSDNYRFVEQGVPALQLMTGFGGAGAVDYRYFMAHHYHKPSDDLRQPIRYEVGAKWARLNYEVTRLLGDADARPVWNKGDFFGEKFAHAAK
jgi:hypothetical protein